MPPYLNIAPDMRNREILVFEAMAENNDPRSHRRLERADPPLYESPTDSEENWISEDGSLDEELQAILDEPIQDSEIEFVVSMISDSVHPMNIYHQHAKIEEARFLNNPHLRGQGRPKLFQKLDGCRRQGVIVRHCVKRRWQKLGIWNPDWGFAGRRVHDCDNARKWKWWWQAPRPIREHMGDRAHDPAWLYDYSQYLLKRAIRKRQNLRRGEHVLVPPQSRLSENATVTEAEDWLISRPWFVFHVEVGEESARRYRLVRTNQTQALGGLADRDQVIQRWIERGDWRDEYDKTGAPTAWKWRHESPSPEPEDLKPISKMKDSVMDAADEMEFTPSEIDDFDTIDHQICDWPDNFWYSGGDAPPYFPGQMGNPTSLDLRRQKEERLQRERMTGLHTPGPHNEDRFDPLFRGKPARFPPLSGVEEDETPVDETSVDEQEPTPLPPVRPPIARSSARNIRAQRQQTLQQRRAKKDSDATDHNAPSAATSPPPLRRSARIAARKLRAEHPPPETASRGETEDILGSKAIGSSITSAGRPSKVRNIDSRRTTAQPSTKAGAATRSKSRGGRKTGGTSSGVRKPRGKGQVATRSGRG
ncbi:hypothetical protein F5Y15DRAFT_425879 [Xylariaceae sp. FL0016]|nr:hypothetical protein F5Y15DRAFT_425879 [Xylariaceae sp. FL0016]